MAHHSNRKVGLTLISYKYFKNLFQIGDQKLVKRFRSRLNQKHGPKFISSYLPVNRIEITEQKKQRERARKT